MGYSWDINQLYWWNMGYIICIFDLYPMFHEKMPVEISTHGAAVYGNMTGVY
jgi:hypothetical protein